jgi:hypothetical protein
MTERSLSEYAAGIVGLFAVVGVGVGLAANFSLAFLIEWQVEPGTDPTSNTLVGLTLIQSLLFPLSVGPLVAASANLAAGYSLGDRRLVATLLGAGSSVVGFYVMALLALFLTVSVLSQYASGGGGASGLPTGMLLTAIGETGIPVGIVGGVSGYLGSRFSD